MSKIVPHSELQRSSPTHVHLLSCSCSVALLATCSPSCFCLIISASMGVTPETRPQSGCLKPSQPGWPIRRRPAAVGAAPRQLLDCSYSPSPRAASRSPPPCSSLPFSSSHEPPWKLPLCLSSTDSATNAAIAAHIRPAPPDAPGILNPGRSRRRWRGSIQTRPRFV